MTSGEVANQRQHHLGYATEHNVNARVSVVSWFLRYPITDDVSVSTEVMWGSSGTEEGSLPWAA